MGDGHSLQLSRFYAIFTVVGMYVKQITMKIIMYAVAFFD
ncbi:MAG: hypothetical protein ACI90V_014439 [Bacillariaceae sp.]